MGTSKGIIPCGAITHGGRILLLQRAADVPRNANVWVMPGGKIEPGETPRGTAIREIREETGIDLQPEALVCLDIFDSPVTNGDPHDPGPDWYDLVVYRFTPSFRPHVVIEPAKFQGYGWFRHAEIIGLRAASPADQVAERLGL